MRSRAALAIPGYVVAETVYEGPHNVVLRARDDATGRWVILKLPKSDCPSAGDLARYEHEHRLIRRVDDDHVIRALDLRVVRGRPVLVLEDFGGVSLRRRAPPKGDIATLVRIGIAIAEGIAAIHAAGEIHKDINPSNLVFNAATGQLKIIDFGIATTVARQSASLDDAGLVQGTIAYVSPEQTGRTNRVVDYRTDFYSFGVTLYELFTGKVPFVGDDALAVVHGHIARQPAPVHEVAPNVPRPLSDIVARLLAKAPEERYQSAWGVRTDLAECLRQLESRGEIAPFRLGRSDVPESLHLPQTIYGRDQEIAELVESFERVAAGSRELLLVSGHAGVGKTRLVRELFPSLTRRRGYFAAGKFDLLQRNVPYAGLLAALRALLRQLLAESDTRLRRWRAELATALGANAQVLVAVLPELELILGPQPPVAPLPSTESQHRFNRVFLGFVHAFAQRDHPLVLFLDDLQWVDAATLALLELVMTDEETGHLLLLGAYRDNELSDDHPLATMLGRLTRQGAALRRIALAPLDARHLAQLIADALGADVDGVRPLAALVERKTGGNPFFVGQFLHTLCEEGLLQFETGEPPRWRWDLSRIEARDITDNVVELVLEKLRRLPAPALDTLRVAAYLGGQFEVRILARVDERTPQEVLARLAPAVDAGLILPIGPSEGAPEELKFLHDRVQQAARALTDERDRANQHLRLGRVLRAEAESSGDAKRIFEAADHLNRARALIADAGERTALARLDLEAARRAKSSAAHVAALGYAEAGMSVFPGDWASQYELTLGLLRERAELEFLTGKPDRAERFLDAIWEGAALLDRVESEAQRVTQRTVLGRNDDAIDAAARALALVGIRFPDERELEAGVDEEWGAIEEALAGRSIASLVDLPTMSAPDIRAAMKVLMTVHTAAYFANRYSLYAWLLARMTRLSMTHGNVPESSKGYASFGNTLSARGGRHEEGYAFGQLGLALADRYGDQSLRCKACLILSMFLNHWVRPIAEAAAFDDAGQLAGELSGEVQFVGYILSYGRTANRFYAGDPLGHLLAETQRYLAFARKAQHNLSADNILAARLVLAQMTGATRDARSFDTDESSEADFLATCERHGSFAAICFFRTIQAFALYLEGDVDGARAAIESAQPLLGYIRGVLTEAEHVFHDALIVAAGAPDEATARASGDFARLESDLRRLHAWAEHCPANFLHEELLVRAEMARLANRTDDAMTLYDRSIAAAADNGFPHHEALATELAARFWLSRGKPDFAAGYLQRALDGYRAWGARRKEQSLLAMLPELRLGDDAASGAPARSTSYTRHLTTSAFDLESVIKASQAISSEIVLDQLLDHLLHVLIENAGAQRAAVVLRREGRFVVAACLEDTAAHARRPDAPVDETRELPSQLVHYVARTHESVALAEAVADGLFTDDPYVVATRLRSALCVPILHGGELLGVVYLENNRLAGAFSPGRVQLVGILASQAAIALENARLFAEAKRAVQLRDEFMAIAAHELRTPLTAVRFHNELLRRRLERAAACDPAERESILAAVDASLRQLDHLQRLFEGMLDTSIIGAGGLRLNVERVDLGALARDAVERYAIVARNAGCDIALAIEPDVTGTWDRARLEQLLTNLLANAVKYGAGRPIDVKVAREDGRACLSVRDRGIGIDKHAQGALFERFARAAPLRHYGGFGIGLYVAREIARAHGGDIRVASEPGKGATFVVELPFESAFGGHTFK